MWAGIRQKIRQKISHWQNPKATGGELILNRHRIYIIPNRAGLVYVLLLLCIFITSINYSLNLGYALNFVLVACGWLAIHLTYRNLSGLGLTASPGQAVFLGDLAHFNIHLNNHSSLLRYALAVGFTRAAMQMTDVPEYSNCSLTLAQVSTARGWMACPTVRIQTTFPCGLLNAWSYWKTDRQILVYPQPEANPPSLPLHYEDSAGAQYSTGSDEFSGLRNYRPGDTPRQLAWRQMARQSTAGNEVMLSKIFEGGQKKICMLDFAQLPHHLSLEQKLARLCAWLLAAENQQISYAFRLGNLHYPQNSGQHHQEACLRALALFGLHNE